jgi:hypothetical protein
MRLAMRAGQDSLLTNGSTCQKMSNLPSQAMAWSKPASRFAMSPASLGLGKWSSRPARCNVLSQVTHLLALEHLTSIKSAAEEESLPCSSAPPTSDQRRVGGTIGIPLRRTVVCVHICYTPHVCTLRDPAPEVIELASSLCAGARSGYSPLHGKSLGTTFRWCRLKNACLHW